MPALVQDKISIAKISANIGAEIIGLDLTKPVDTETRQRLLDTLHDRIALVIRGQDFTPRQFVAAGRVFGTLMQQDQPEIYCLPEEPLIRRVSNMHRDKSGKIAKNVAMWHTDHTNHERPPKYTMLYPVLLPSSGGGTSVCNTRAGYAALPADLKKRIDGMRTVNVLSGRGVRTPNPLSVQGEKDQKSVEVLQPLVRTHPDHGGKAVYFHPKKTDRIDGMTPETSQDLLDDLRERLIRPEFIYTHTWRNGDLLIWDNRSSLHKAGTDFDDNQHRLLYRLIVEGERPY